MLVLNYDENLTQKLKYVDSFDLFKDGEIIKIKKGDHEFERYFKCVKFLFENARVMPAFGVSLHGETLNALKKGEWFQINFEKELDENGMLFDALLFKLEKTGGINLIRKNNNKYEGRCVFLDFDNVIDLEKFFNFS